MINKKILGLGTIILLTLMSKTSAVRLWVPNVKVNGDLKYNPTQIEGSRSIFNLINFVNSYIWFGIGLVCFLFMIINGYKLITAHGDEKKTKEATSALGKSIIGIAICLLAYIIVNLAVRLFA